MFCDFILLNYVSERKIVSMVNKNKITKCLIFQIKQKKYEVLEKHSVLSGLLSIMSVANTDTAEPQDRNMQQVVYGYLSSRSHIW